MAVSIKSLIETWDGLGVVMRYDQPTGAWIFIALHNDTLGMPSGGTRMKEYPSEAAGLRDAMRLAAGMTSKWAAVDFDFGGGKAVIAIPGPLEPDARRGLLTRYGQLLDSLHGAFATGVDLGTDTEDMLLISQYTKYVHGVDRDARVAVDPGPYTALGVLAGIRASVNHVYGSPDLKGRTVHVQGVGDVGAPLTRLLKEQGAQLVLSDLNSRRAERLAEEVGGAETFEPHTAYAVSCDVFAPCAVGGTLNDETIPALTCRIVAGSANNQLEEPRHADMLHERGIIYAPDYIVNAGGAIALAMLGRGAGDDEVRRRVRAIEPALGEILIEASAEKTSPVHAADRVVERRLAAAAP